MSEKGKKRKKNYYVQKAKKFKNSGLEIGMKGFLLTCNNKEPQSVREAYNILNEYADKLYGSQKEATKSDSDEEEEDIEAALKKEVTELQETAKSSQFRFKVVDSGANNCIFIRTSLENPTELVDSIYRDLYETRIAKSRFIMRFLPVQVTCKANEDTIKKAASQVLPLFFKTTHTYAIMFKVRNNNSIGRNQVMPVIGEVINELNPFNSVDFANPDLVINVDILKTVCCISVLKDYYKYRKYNFQEVVCIKDARGTSQEVVCIKDEGDKSKNVSVNDGEKPKETDCDKSEGESRKDVGVKDEGEVSICEETKVAKSVDNGAVQQDASEHLTNTDQDNTDGVPSAKASEEVVDSKAVDIGSEINSSLTGNTECPDSARKDADTGNNAIGERNLDK